MEHHRIHVYLEHPLQRSAMVQIMTVIVLQMKRMGMGMAFLTVLITAKIHLQIQKSTKMAVQQHSSVINSTLLMVTQGREKIQIEDYALQQIGKAMNKKVRRLDLMTAMQNQTIKENWMMTDVWQLLLLIDFLFIFSFIKAQNYFIIGVVRDYSLNLPISSLISDILSNTVFVSLFI